MQAEEKNGHYVAIEFITANNHTFTFEFVRDLLVRAKESSNWLLLNKMRLATNKSVARLQGVSNCMEKRERETRDGRVECDLISFVHNNYKLEYRSVLF